MTFTQLDVADLLPHAGGMILLDRVVAADEQSLSAEVVVRNDGIFSDDDGAVSVAIGVEYMAQTIAAFAGVRALAAQDEVRLGMLLGVRGYRAPFSHFFPGQRLIVTARLMIESPNGLGVFDCEINGDEFRISARLTVIEVDRIPEAIDTPKPTPRTPVE
jgi:predicted hotdog family 3-hydroxylacyl-ACP dehydratase